jgi:hypothetical protein
VANIGIIMHFYSLVVCSCCRYLRNVTTGDEMVLVRNAFNHSTPGAPAGVGVRDFGLQWMTPAPKEAFRIPAACASTELAGVPPETGILGNERVAMPNFGDRVPLRKVSDTSK